MLEELSEEVSGLEHDLESTADESEPQTVREKREEAQELVEEIEKQLEFLSKVAEKDHNG